MMVDWVKTVISLYGTIAVYSLTWALARKALYSIIGAVSDGEIDF